MICSGEFKRRLLLLSTIILRSNGPTSHNFQSIHVLTSDTCGDLSCTHLLKSIKLIFTQLLKSMISPISGTRGSSGLGSVRREQIDRRSLLIVSAGDHLDL